MQHSLHVLLVDDEEIVHETIGGYLQDSGHHVDHAGAGRAALQRIQACDYDLALLDVRMPGMDGLSLLAKAQEIRPEMSSVIMTAHADMNTAIRALRSGAVDFLCKPIKLLELDAVLEKAIRVRRLRQDKRHLRETIRGIQASEDLRVKNRMIVGESRATAEVRAQVQEVVAAGCDTILITGETGSGKEVVARAIHFTASSEESPFIAVSCPALPDSLVESELFGHMKGAFTGAATDRVGYFELADGGTLFLDEVADLSASAQAAFLRVLESRTFRRVGGTEEISVKLRVIAATNVRLEDLVEQGKFRRDLFYRINVYQIHLLPLRKRRDDIIPLAEHFLSTYAATRGSQFEGFSPEAKSLLLNYDFPGNARELRNLVERAAILSRSGLITPRHFNLPKRPAPHAGRKARRTEEDQERNRILEALKEAKWNRRQAAKDLGMPYSTLRYKIQKLRIE